VKRVAVIALAAVGLTALVKWLDGVIERQDDQIRRELRDY
jgi:hypothetical protein